MEYQPEFLTNKCTTLQVSYYLIACHVIDYSDIKSEYAQLDDVIFVDTYNNEKHGEYVLKFTSGEIESFFLDEVMDSFINVIEKNKTTLKQKIFSNSLCTKLEVLVKIENMQAASLEINKKCINFLKDFDTTLSIDSYIYS